MEKFRIICINDIKNIKQYKKSCEWRIIPIMPYFAERYVCFSRNYCYSFYELINEFLRNNDNEQIGAMSIIINNNYSQELYEFICNNSIPLKKLKFIYDNVIPYELPLIIPRDKMDNYEFDGVYLRDVWVKLFLEIRMRLL